MGSVLVSVTGGVGLLTGAKGLIGKGGASGAREYIVENFFQPVGASS
jgi:hypothetical protein